MYNVNFGIFNTFLIQLDEFVQRLGLSWPRFDPQPFLPSPDQALLAVAAVVVWPNGGFQVVIFLAGRWASPLLLQAARRRCERLAHLAHHAAAAERAAVLGRHLDHRVAGCSTR